MERAANVWKSSHTSVSLPEPERDCAESQSQRVRTCCGWSATQPRSGVECASNRYGESFHKPERLLSPSFSSIPNGGAGGRRPGE